MLTKGAHETMTMTMTMLQDKFQRMLRLQSRLGDWELIKPGRELIKEGELHKISRKGFGSRYNMNESLFSPLS